MRRALRGVLRRPLLRRLATRAAAQRGHGLVLLYHRVDPDPDGAGASVVPTVSSEQLERHVAVLRELGEIVDLRALLGPADQRRRPRFALTFDDDYVSHVAHALPVLRAAGVVATFFLGGRCLHGRGPYWWESLERLVRACGLDGAARAIGADPVGTATELALACERDPRLRTIVEDAAGQAEGETVLDEDGIARLAAEGMTIGFHTVDHPVLPTLEDHRLSLAVVRGRAELEAAVGGTIGLFAYPHGKVDRRAVDAVRAAGYDAAWTGHPRPARADDEPFRRGRWEPGPLDEGTFAASLAIRLHRSAPATGAA